MAPGNRQPRHVSSSQSQAIPTSNTPSHSSSLASTANSRKGGRKKAENKALKNYFKHGGQKPRIEFSSDKNYPVGEWTQMWITELGIICKQAVPCSRHKWKEVTPTEREPLYQHILGKFDVDLSKDHVMRAMNKSFSKVFREFRHNLHKHYLAIPEGVNKREKSPDELSQENWEILCDWFESEEFKKISRRNKSNRKCNKVNHRGGSRAFVRHRYEQRDPVTNTEPTRVDFYRTMYYNDDKGWIDPQAQENYPQEEGTVVLTDDEIVDKVLGIRSGYVLGLVHGELAPSSRGWAGNNHPEVDHLRRRAEDAEAKLAELRVLQQTQQEQMNATQRQVAEQGRMLEILMAQHQSTNVGQTNI